MKKRLISLLVALCMAVTLLPVSALTAWAEEGDQLKIVNGYPVGSGGEDWSYDGATLDLHPASPTDYDFSKLISGRGNVLACALKIGEKATITDGRFINNITNSGTITGGVFQPLSSSQSLTFENSGIITGGEFLSTLGPLYFTNNISGTIEGGIFSVSSLSNSGAINGGVFPRRPNGDKVAAGYTLNVESPDSTTEAGIEYFKDSRYIIPHSSYTASITVLYYNRLGLQPFPIDVAFNNTQMLLEDWAQTVEYPKKDWNIFYVTFTAPPAKANTVTLSKLTRLVIDKAGYPVGTEGGTQGYSGNGWKFENGTLTLESGDYDFSGEGNALNPAVQLEVKSGATLAGGTFAAGLYYNNGEITGGAFNGKEDRIFTNETVLSGNYRSVTVNGGAIVKVNDTFPLVYDKTAYDLVQGTAWDLYSYAGTVLTVKADADITNINGQKIGKAFSSYYLNGETDKKVVRFVMPDSDVELNSTKIVVPDPKPEPKPEPEPEAPTYTLTVKGGTFTYNGGEAMTSASVPVDAEVKVTLNQSAVPEGMVFDLWAMDEASLLGNPAVAYNEENFTIPAGSMAKGSTVTVEAQYRDATIESEPSVLGTAAIIGVAGAGTAVIVWQGYRIGMELYEKYFQPTPEETAAEQPAPEAPAAAAAS